MALFSRRSKKPAAAQHEASAIDADSRTEPAVADAPSASTGAEGAGNATDAAAGPTRPESSSDAPAADAEVAASVSISLSSYAGLGSVAVPTPLSAPGAPAPAGDAPAAPRARPAARAATETAPAATETLPGLRDNVLLREALARVEAGPASAALLDVARQLLQGHVFLRVRGDARTLLAEGKDLPLAAATAGERSFALVYSSGAALQASLKADGDTDTSAMAQPVLPVLRHVLAGTYDGVILDHASAPARAVLPRELLQKMVEQMDPKLTVKNLLTAERTPARAAEVSEALTRVPLWVAVGTAEGGQPGLAEGRLPDGSRYLEVYSHPLEVAVMGRGDNAAPLSGAQLARALGGATGLSGIVVDPAGPWIRLTLADLAPVLALAD